MKTRLLPSRSASGSALLTGILTLALAPLHSREWKDAASGRTLEAELLGIERGKAVVAADRKRFRLPILQLSEPDQAFLEAWSDGKSAADQLPLPWWPATVQQGNVRVRGGPQADGTFKFWSKHYEFHCDAEVSASVMSDFATVAEGTIRLLYSLPIKYPPLEGKSFQARILSSQEMYAKAGGPPGSAGVFITGGFHGEGVLLVPFQSLGIERFLGRNTKGYDYDATVLIHEIAHQVTAELLPLMPRWMSEGLAEYAANMPYHNGVFHLGVRERELALRQRLEFYQQLSRKLGVNAGSRWVLTPSELVAMKDAAWVTGNRTQEAQLTLHKLYLSSMFLVHYFLHYADDGEARRIRLYFHELNDAALYIRTHGEQGVVPESLENHRELTLNEIRSFFLRELFRPEELPSLDRQFRVKFAELGFRL